MKYRMIEKRGDINTKLYTVEELKNYFSPLDTGGDQIDGQAHGIRPTQQSSH